MRFASALNDAMPTFAVLAKIIAPLAVKPSSGREIINRKDRNGGAKIARDKSTQPAVGSLQPAIGSTRHSERKEVERRVS